MTAAPSPREPTTERAPTPSAERLRVALVTSEYPSETYFAGGIASCFHRTAKALIAHGHEAEVFTLSDTQETILYDSVSVHRVTAGSLKGRIASARLLWRYTGYADALGPSLRLASRLRARHRERPFSVVQAASYRAVGLAAALWKVAPLVTFAASFAPQVQRASMRAATRSRAQMAAAEVLLCRLSSALYAPSRLLADTLEHSHGLPAVVLEPPFYLERQGPDAPSSGDAPVLELPDIYGLFFGAIGLVKGCDRLVRVLPALLERNDDFHFVFIGRVQTLDDGRPFDDVIRHELSAYASRIHVLPALRPASLHTIVERARFVVLPSRIDNLPNACLEAMALERVVIATHGASFDQVIEHGINGFLVAQDDDAELLTHMDRIWRLPPETRREIGSRAARSLERMRPDIAIPALVSLFDQTIRRHSTGTVSSIRGRDGR